MAFKTMQQLITATEREIYQSAGAQVQLYSQDLIMQHLQNAFTHLFDMHWWPRFNARYTLTLDGVTGQTTTVPALITEYKDLRYVYYDYDRRPLPILPQTLNTTTLADFTRPRFMEPTSDDKLFRVWPMSAVGTVLLIGRARPNEFIITDTVPFDDLLLRHFAAWSYFTDDDSNPNSATKHQGLFENRLKMIEDSEFNQPVALNNRSSEISDRWTENWG